jgi:hypothetical protein
MNPPIPAHSSYGVWLRSPSPSGGKDWLAFLTERQVVSCWGKTGAVRQSKTVSDRPSRIDLHLKMEEKLRKGYRLLGEYRPQQGWSFLPATPSAPDNPLSSPAMTPSPSPAPAPTPEPPLQRWLNEAEPNWF